MLDLWSTLNDTSDVIVYNSNLSAGCSEKVQRSSHLHCLHQVFFSNQHTRWTYDHCCIIHNSKCTYTSSKCVRYYLRELPDPLFCSAFARSNQLLYIYRIAQHSGSKLSWRAFTFVRPQMFFCVNSFSLHAHFLPTFFRRQWATTNAIKDDRRRMKEIDRLLDEIPTANKRNIEFLFKFLAQLTVEEVNILAVYLFLGKRNLVDLTSKKLFWKHNWKLLAFSLCSTSCV